MELFEIRYVSLFRYPAPVWDSHNVLRACPCTDARQLLLSYRLAVEPISRVQSYSDYFGTRVDVFGVARPHRELEIAAEIRVSALSEAETPRAAGGLDLPGFAEEHWEYRVPSAHTAFGESLAREARDVVAGCGADPVAMASALAEHVRATLRYAPGSTHVGIDVNEIQRSRRGVCQDYAHYLVALARSVGLPARYVSGYLFAARGDDAGAPDADEILVQTHAWAEVAIPGAGWWPLDPTNRIAVGARHVKIGHGRDYDDVQPLRGVYHGPFSHELEVSVHMRRLAPGAAPRALGL